MSSHTNPYWRAHKTCHGSLHFTTTTDDTTLVTAASTTQQIHINRVIISIKTDAAQSLTFEDSNSSAVYVCKVTTSPGADTRWDFDFGEKGVPLTAGKNFVMNASAVGLAGHVEWQGYRKG